MKKILAVVCALFLLMGVAMAEETPAIKLGQIEYAAHGAQCFAVITVAMQGDIIVAAHIDEFQVMQGENVVGVPNSDAAFGGNIVGSDEGKVLGSKRVNNEYYSNNMATKAGSTVKLADNYAAIESFVAGKTIAEVEELVVGKEAADVIDAVAGATLVDTQGYILGIIAAAKATALQTGTYAIVNQTGEAVTELYIAHNADGEKGENLLSEPLAAEGKVIVTKSIPASADGHHALTFSFVTESGRTGEFAKLSIEEATMTLLAADAMTGATPFTFGPFVAE